VKEDERFCVNCRHHLTGRILAGMYCKEVVSVSKVHGKNPSKCSKARSNNGECGPNGKLWDENKGFWKRLFERVG